MKQIIKRLLGLALCISILTFTLPAIASESERTSPYKTVVVNQQYAVASSVEVPELSADKAVDGDETTRWSSAYSDSEWIYVDLGETKNISSILLKWEACALEYEIQVSDNANTWTTVYSTTTGDGGEDYITGLTASGRYIKMQGIKRATPFGYSLYEFEVYTDTDLRAVASSAEVPELSADKAVDGDGTTRWASAYSDSEWIYIDLGETKNISSVLLKWEACALEYEIQVSDDANIWTTVYSTTAGDGGIDYITGLTVSGRYVKMQGIKRATPFGYSLYEFKIYTDTDLWAVASSVEVPELSADKAVDGDETTRWSSAYSDSEWIYVDLGQIKNINRIVLKWEAYALQYEIQVSDDANIWTAVYSTATGDGGTDDISGFTAKGRYVKMQGIKRATPFGYSLYEFTVDSSIDINRPPVLEIIGNKTVDEGKSLEFRLNATDPDADTLTYTANNLPEDAVFNPMIGAFSWTPDYTQAGTYIVHFEVSDGDLIDSEDIAITVNDVKYDKLIIDAIEYIKSLKLPKGTENSLISTLDNAAKSLKKGNINAGINQLEAFNNKVKALQDQKLINTQADTLIQIVRTIIYIVGL